jgi:Cu+-exporting ATPase
MKDCCSNEDKNVKMSVEDKSIFWGVLSGLILIGFYIGVLTIFQGFNFALNNLRSLWYLIFPLVIGFGIQIGLFVSIKNHAKLKGTVATTGGISGGTMVACCTHFLLNIIPIAGASGLSIFLMKYQPTFLSLGILANVLGIVLMIRHKRKMLRYNLKGGDL